MGEDKRQAAGKLKAGPNGLKAGPDGQTNLTPVEVIQYLAGALGDVSVKLKALSLDPPSKRNLERALGELAVRVEGAADVLGILGNPPQEVITVSSEDVTPEQIQILKEYAER